MKKIKFNNREIDILNTIWSTEKSLSAMDVVNLSNISKNMVHSILKKLIDKNCIRFDEIILSGKTLTRTYSRVIDREQFILQQYEDLEIESLLNHFLNSEENMNNISKIEELIEIKKKADEGKK